MNHYIKNNETQKLELHFSKAAYMALSEAQKKEIKSNFLFSSHAGAWVSRAKYPNYYRAETVAKSLNLEYKGEEGEVLTFAEQVEAQTQKAANRASYYGSMAGKKFNISTAAYKACQNISSFIPMGQPILVGHHSERRHSRDINRMDNLMRRSVEESNKAEYYQDRSKTAQWTADQVQLKNPVYLGNRIRECEAAIRGYDRRIEGTDSADYIQRLNEFKAREIEKLDFYKGKLSAFEIHTKDSLKEMKATHIKYRGTWYPIKSLNAKSVTVLNWIGIARASWKPDYTDIKGVKTLEDMHVVFDRDGKEVKPSIKY